MFLNNTIFRKYIDIRGNFDGFCTIKYKHECVEKHIIWFDIIFEKKRFEDFFSLAHDKLYIFDMNGIFQFVIYVKTQIKTDSYIDFLCYTIIDENHNVFAKTFIEKLKHTTILAEYKKNYIQLINKTTDMYDIFIYVQ